jgi:hypothetical protein
MFFRNLIYGSYLSSYFIKLICSVNKYETVNINSIDDSFESNLLNPHFGFAFAAFENVKFLFILKSFFKLEINFVCLIKSGLEINFAFHGLKLSFPD